MKHWIELRHPNVIQHAAGWVPTSTVASSRALCISLDTEPVSCLRPWNPTLLPPCVLRLRTCSCSCTCVACLVQAKQAAECQQTSAYPLQDHRSFRPQQHVELFHTAPGWSIHLRRSSINVSRRFVYSTVVCPAAIYPTNRRDIMCRR